MILDRLASLAAGSSRLPSANGLSQRSFLQAGAAAGRVADAKELHAYALICRSPRRSFLTRKPRHAARKGPRALARELTAAVAVPTIGIGGSPACDGQILVIDDMLGLFTEFTPKFVKRYRRLGDEIRTAAREYAEEVRQGRFPAAEHTYSR